MTQFEKDVYRIVAKIPKGKTATYGQVAALAGRPKAARAVGDILSKNLDPKVPCHRVIRSDGKLGGYNGIRGEKAALLKSEGYVNVSSA